jgi:hypothetical protein
MAAVDKDEIMNNSLQVQSGQHFTQLFRCSFGEEGALALINGLPACAKMR